VTDAFTRRRFQARGIATRARCLAAAEDLVTRRGYDGTSMADVAARAGVGVGTLYHHFPDKRALLLELIDAWGERLSHLELDPARFFGDDPRAAISRWLRGAYDRQRKRPSLYVVVSALAGRDPEVNARWRRIQEGGIERLRALFVGGQQLGHVRASLDAGAAAFLVHHAIDAAALQLLVLDAPHPEPDRVLAELAEMLSRHLLEERP
jgi:AcrR family transcriptional regulator